MLKLVDIKKDYVMSDESVHALKGVTVNFRRNEFVAILGQSGCGKTTLLNIIGGLDRYTSGDLIIEGKSTKSYKDGDWDTYRNHSVGFIFQSYNLISHINILKNVELALTISGIDKKERRIRAEQALESVGLKGQGKKKPNQLSGGQMQRVAIARALVNNPEIVLADEPTGALDSETSVQIMELLKEVAKDRLVVMVTHNPDLAKKYATRIINMKDGLLVGDSNPYEGESHEELKKASDSKQDILLAKGRKKQTSMSFWTALGLSFNNLMTKKARTFLISFAGSIGIIGIAMILSLSFGFNNYISDVQSNSMSTYPLTIYETQSDQNMMEVMMGGNSEHQLDKYSDKEEVHENSSMTEMLSKMLSVKHTDLKSFKEYLERPDIAEKFDKVTLDIRYGYDKSINIFAVNGLNGEKLDEPVRLSPVGSWREDTYVFDASTYQTKNGEPLSPNLDKVYKNIFYGEPGEHNGAANFVSDAINMVGGNPFTCLLDAPELLDEQFDVLTGHFPTNENEVVIKVNKYNEIPDLFLYGIGLKDISYMMSQYIYGQIAYSLPTFPKPVEHEDQPLFSSTFDELLGMEFALVNPTQFYEKIDAPESEWGHRYRAIYDGKNHTESFMDVLNNTMKLKVVGIVRPKKSASMTSINAAIGYHPNLYNYLFGQNENPTDERFKTGTALYDQMHEAKPYDVFTGNPFIEGKGNRTYESNINALGKVFFEDPSVIYIYPNSFTSKATIIDYINEYNTTEALYDEEKKIVVVDNVGMMIDSVQIVVDSVTYVLIAFVSISLLVSSIMIGIITYVSVLERTKEIGVLRSIGARKKDISRVFNAETLIIGLVAGLLGIGVSAILNIPIMVIINVLTDIGLTVVVPWYGAVFLPIISVMLTIVAGLIPSSIASKRDPVIALRTE